MNLLKKKLWKFFEKLVEIRRRLIVYDFLKIARVVINFMALKTHHNEKVLLLN